MVFFLKTIKGFMYNFEKFKSAVPDELTMRYARNKWVCRNQAISTCYAKSERKGIYQWEFSMFFEGGCRCPWRPLEDMALQSLPLFLSLLVAANYSFAKKHFILAIFLCLGLQLYAMSRLKKAMVTSAGSKSWTSFRLLTAANGRGPNSRIGPFNLVIKMPHF